MPGLPPSLEEIADRLAISDVIDTYAAAIDARDYQTAASVFEPDAVLDYTDAGLPRGTRDEVIAAIAKALEQVTLTQHLIVNRRITVDGETATAHAQLFNPIGVAGPQGEMVLSFVGGSYADRLRRTPDGWRIVERVATLTWIQGPAARAFGGR